MYVNKRSSGYNPNYEYRMCQAQKKKVSKKHSTRSNVFLFKIVAMI